MHIGCIDKDIDISSMPLIRSREVVSGVLCAFKINRMADSSFIVPKKRVVSPVCVRVVETCRTCFLI